MTDTTTASEPVAACGCPQRRLDGIGHLPDCATAAANLARCDYLHGLQQLVDFLEQHPEVPLPDKPIRLAIVPGARAAAVVAALTAGQDHVEFAPYSDSDGVGSSGALTRRFGPVAVEAWVRADAVGTATPVERTVAQVVVEFQPYTPAELAARAATKDAA